MDLLTEAARIVRVRRVFTLRESDFYSLFHFSFSHNSIVLTESRNKFFISSLKFIGIYLCILLQENFN